GGRAGRGGVGGWGGGWGGGAAGGGGRGEAGGGGGGVAGGAEQAVWSLSRGLAQRAAIAKALIHDPPVLLLDEPFTGLDLAAAAEFRALLARLQGAGRVVVLATHNVGEGVELATDVAFQRRGRFVHFAPRGRRGPAQIADQ